MELYIYIYVTYMLHIYIYTYTYMLPRVNLMRSVRIILQITSRSVKFRIYKPKNVLASLCGNLLK